MLPWDVLLKIVGKVPRCDALAQVNKKFCELVIQSRSQVCAISQRMGWWQQCYNLDSITVETECTSLEFIGMLPCPQKLKYLSLSSPTYLADDQIMQMSRLKSLEHLECIFDTQCNERLSRPLLWMCCGASLLGIRLHGCTGVNIMPIKSLPMLQALDLFDCKTTIADINHWDSGTLTRLIVDNRSTYTMMDRIETELLDLTGITALEELQFVCMSFRRMTLPPSTVKCLRLFCCKRFRFNILTAIELRALKELEIMRCWVPINIGTDLVRILPRTLESLSIAGIDEKDNQLVILICKTIPALRHLNFSGGGRELTYQGLSELTQLRLVSLDISDWRMGSNQALAALRLPDSLRYLNLSRSVSDYPLVPGSLTHLTKHLTWLTLKGVGVVAEDFDGIDCIMSFCIISQRFRWRTA